MKFEVEIAIDQRNSVDIDIFSAKFDNTRHFCINSEVETKIVSIAACLAEA